MKHFGLTSKVLEIEKARGYTLSDAETENERKIDRAREGK